MNRRDLLKTGLAAGATLALPPTVAAQARTGNPRDAALAAIAREQVEKAGDLLWRRDIVGVVDYGLRSSEERFHFVDLARGQVNSYLVSHGDGSDPEHDGWLNWYSNEYGSHCSCEGTFVTYGWYTGKYGTSIRLDGLDPTNNNALDRAIVMHRAGYAERSHLERWGRLGRSNGCFAMGDADFKTALYELGGGAVLWAGSLGLAPDGSKVTPPAPEPAENVEPLQSDPPQYGEILQPGVY
ncbi:murein L,D-transpeptidase catalytic domain-containing protein [Qipengyuania sp. JC766]|uniref:murein L,D-transpeptidase catalytic domain-containing protein n=1 Tax=Qipengyuania sp. JC766 TaxID=3232139 RepID=UPI003458F443